MSVNRTVVSITLRPGVKLQLQGQMVCRLGMLLLGPSNVKVLGGEVEGLVGRNNQVNCGFLLSVKSRLKRISINGERIIIII